MMAHTKMIVEWVPEDMNRLPDQLSSSATVLLKLKGEGLLEDAAKLLKARRQGGYSAMALWVALVIYMSSRSVDGIRPSWEAWRGKMLDKLAALAGLRSCPRSASLSRGLSAFEFELLRPVAPWLLEDAPEIDPVLRHPAMLTWDACGQGWQVFDLDPTVTVCRERALPQGDDLPDPILLAERMASPGHRGRKRGELVFRRTTVQHAGSGLWIHAHLSQGNGEGVEDLGRSLDATVATCKRIEHPLSRVLLRMDGEYGNVPSYTACRERGLPFITRLNRPKLYEHPAVLARLREGPFEPVPDSRSGPQRYAVEIGTMLIAPGATTRRPDGTPYAPIRLRVVASVYLRYRDKKQRGKLVDGIQVELFAVDVPADAWPAAEAVASYFGRIAQENRFAQEDREKKLDRIISYNLPGQELATLTGLMLWNLEIVEGFKLAPPPQEQAPQTLRVTHNEHPDIIPQQWPRDPLIQDLLGTLDWSELLQGRSDWSWDADSGLLLCPEGRPMELTSVNSSPMADGQKKAIFRRRRGECEDCAARPGCLQSSQERASKLLKLSIPAGVADDLRERLRLVRAHPSDPPLLTPCTATPGPFDVRPSLFLPARARQLFHASIRGATFHVVVQIPPVPQRPPLLADDVGDRQRRRKTWEQNQARYALPEGSVIRLKIEAGEQLAKLLPREHIQSNSHAR